VQKSIKIGTRGSPLAMAQAHEVKNHLIAAHEALDDANVEIQVIKVMGDQIVDRSLMSAGGKGLFTKEIEQALLDGTIDMAVHSTKDMPTQLPKGLVLSAFLKREDPRDVLVSTGFSSLDDLPNGALIGTASLRRRAQLLNLRPDLKVINFRGNVQTRLKKLEAGEANATFLALAGLNRLGMGEVATEILPLNSFLPAPAQGAVTIEIREGDAQTANLLKPLHDSNTAKAVTAERALLAALDGSCRTPIAALAVILDDEISIIGEILSVDGAIRHRETASGPASNAELIGKAVGGALRERAGDAFFEQLIRDVEEIS